MTGSRPESEPRRERSPGSAGAGQRHRLPDLSALTRALSGSGELVALAERYAAASGRLTASGPGGHSQVSRSRVGADLRHVTYAAIPHGAKTYLAAALVGPPANGSSGSRATRRSPTAWRRSSRPGWATPGRVVTLEPRTSLAYERSELVRDESAARVAALAAWRRADGPARVLVASVQALFQHTLPPDGAPRDAAHPPPRAPPVAWSACSTRSSALGYEHVAGGRRPRRVRAARRHRGHLPGGPAAAVRVEWFGDEIESLRAFDPADQRGVGPVAEATLLPASEFLLAAERGAARGRGWARPPTSCRRAWPGRPRAPRERRRWATPRSCGAATWRRAPASTTWARPSGSSTSPRRSPPRPTSCGRQAERPPGRAGARRRAAQGLADGVPRAARLEEARCSRRARWS